MNKFTAEQVKAIQTWTEKRDALLLEIGNYSSQLNVIKENLKESGLSLADLHQQISEARGRISEIVSLEERLKGSLNTEVAELQVRKSRLEGEVVEKNLELKSAEEKLQVILSEGEELSNAHAVMSDQAKIVNKVVGEIIATSQVHTSDMKTIMAEIRTVATEVINKSNENVKQTGIVLEKLPRYIFELQKPIPLRRTFSVPRGSVIEPEIKESK